EVAKINAAKDELSRAMEAGTTEEIKSKIEALTNEYHVISTKLYEQAAAQQQAQGQAGPNMGGAGFNPNMGGFDPNNMGFNPNMNGQQGAKSDDNVVDADFEVVDDDKKNQ
ncbi:MAG: hypothetical protein IJL27_09735, partial [Firmicutes bacterium]|nr:hypothetical protein [Bacillota bacterium]